MLRIVFASLLILWCGLDFTPQHFVSKNSKGHLQYFPDEQGNVLPDFSRVGFRQGADLPVVKTVVRITPDGLHDQEIIQRAIDSLSVMPVGKTGYRGAILLAAGTWRIPGSVHIGASGIVLRGEGAKTVLLAVGKGQRSLIMAAGTGRLQEIAGTRVRIEQDFVPLGTKRLKLAATLGFHVGDSIVVYRPATENWIHDLKMDQIHQRDSTIKQWSVAEYGIEFERVITAVLRDSIVLDQPIVMAMESRYGGGFVYRCRFAGRIRNIGVESMSFDSEYSSPIDEDHGWNAILFNRLEDGWVRDVSSIHFGYSCVNLGMEARNITVRDCQCLDPISRIEGGRRYSFNNDGQMNLFMHCYARNGRHDYVTGMKVRGPNVFYDCKAEESHADIGPHHRWAMGTLYDNIQSDGEINCQDRGDWGTGHGWSGVNQVFWNCRASKAAIQDPYVSGKNYVIAMDAQPYNGRLSGRPMTQWYGMGASAFNIPSLYLAQRGNEVSF